MGMRRLALDTFWHCLEGTVCGNTFSGFRSHDHHFFVTSVWAVMSSIAMHVVLKKTVLMRVCSLMCVYNFWITIGYPMYQKIFRASVPNLPVSSLHRRG